MTFGSDYAENQEGIILVYSCNDSKSFYGLEDGNGISPPWFKLFMEKNAIDDRKNIPKVLVCNKIDIPYAQRKVTRKEGLEKASALNSPYVESSAKMNLNVERIWIEIVRQIRYHRRMKIPATKEKLPKGQGVDLPA